MGSSFRRKLADLRASRGWSRARAPKATISRSDTFSLGMPAHFSMESSRCVSAPTTLSNLGDRTARLRLKPCGCVVVGGLGMGSAWLAFLTGAKGGTTVEERALAVGPKAATTGRASVCRSANKGWPSLQAPERSAANSALAYM
eukprot:scaffold7446_cov403-Prasinococcus_capsulatus_cf.AAC.1